MSRKEAIKILRGMKAENLNLNDLYTMDKYVALDMAIEALEAFDEVKIEIGKSKTKCEMQLSENNIKEKMLVSTIYSDIISIIDKYKTESEEK